MVNELSQADWEKASGEILGSALRLLQERTGFPVKVQASRLLIAADQTVDALIRVQIGRLEIPLFVEVKDSVTSSNQISRFIPASKSFPGTWMLIAKYISPAICSLLRTAQIAYVDLTGNIHLPIIIYQRSEPAPKDRPDSIQRTRYRPSIHTDSVTRLLLYFLSNPATLTYRQRHLAEVVGVSPAAINKVIGFLEEMDFLAQQSDGRKIIRRKSELIARWCTSYTDSFRPHQLRGRYRRVKRDPSRHWMKDMDIRGLQAVWGGEPAGAILTRHLEPELFTIYFRGAIQDVLNRFRLTPAADGDIELLEAFWLPILDYETILAPPLITYADLLGSGNERNRETAGILFEKLKLGD